MYATCPAKWASFDPKVVGSIPTGGLGNSPQMLSLCLDDPERPVRYAKCRLPDGRQVQKRIGPAWTERGRPARRLDHPRACELRRAGTPESGRMRKRRGEPVPLDADACFVAIGIAG